jgi:hypothetical protein
VPLRNCFHESLISQNPLAFLSLNPGSFPTATVTVERKKGGTAYRRRGRSGGGLGEVREVLAVTLRRGSSTVMAGIGLAECAGGRARRRRVLRPAHGGRVQSNGTGASLDAKDAIGTRKRRMAYRGAQSTCDGGRLKSGDVNPASLVRWCPIRGSGSFTELWGS